MDLYIERLLDMQIGVAVPIPPSTADKFRKDMIRIIVSAIGANCDDDNVAWRVLRQDAEEAADEIIALIDGGSAF